MNSIHQYTKHEEEEEGATVSSWSARCWNNSLEYVVAKHQYNTFVNLENWENLNTKLLKYWMTMVSKLLVKAAWMKRSERYPDISRQNLKNLGCQWMLWDLLDRKVPVRHWRRAMCFMQRECDLQHSFYFTGLLESFDRISGVGKRYV